MEEFFTQTSELFKKLQQTFLKPNLKYLAQISTSLENETPNYAIQISGIQDGLGPATFLDEDPKKCLEKLEAFIETISLDDVEIKYHEAQIKAAEQTIEHHKKVIEEVKEAHEEYEQFAKKMKKANEKRQRKANR